MILFRPVGLEELRLIDAAGMRAFPPRLPEQPIFYPVLNEEYARQIARYWNAKQHPRVGFVTRFEVEDSYVAKFERHVVGSRVHEELWVPAVELDEFNRHIVGRIEVVAGYFGEGWSDVVSDKVEVARLFNRVAARVEARGNIAMRDALRAVAGALSPDRRPEAGTR